jgi:hypothetical protein
MRCLRLKIVLAVQSEEKNSKDKRERKKNGKK